MDYFTCTTCGHSTMDHEQNAPRPCLMDCACKQMVDGEPFVKPKSQPFQGQREPMFKTKEGEPEK